MKRAQLRPGVIVPSLAAVVIGLSACGSAATPDAGSDTDGTAAKPAPEVIHVAGGFGATPNAAGVASDAESSSKMAVWGGVTYVYEGTPPDLTGPAHSWFFDPAEKASTESVAALAQALGITGDVK